MPIEIEQAAPVVVDFERATEKYEREDHGGGSRPWEKPDDVDPAVWPQLMNLTNLDRNADGDTGDEPEPFF